eukprot:1373929-Rhodomonas_salina.2
MSSTLYLVRARYDMSGTDVGRAFVPGPMTGLYGRGGVLDKGAKRRWLAGKLPRFPLNQT